MKQLLTTLKQKWPEYLLEILVITVGILGAFALNKWSENVSVKREQEKIIENLNEEFATNLESLNSQISRLERKIRACKQMLSVTENPDLKRTIIVDTLVRRIYDNPTWNPSTFVLSDLKNLGKLKTLENERLKFLLHQWDRHFENLREWYGLETTMFDRTVDFMTTNASVRNALYRGLGQSSFAVTNEELFEDYRFENLVAHNLMIAGGLLNIYQTQTIDLINQILEETK